MKFTKLEVARRQVDTAIRLLFTGHDPVSIHTLASAAFRILRDLAEHRNAPIHQVLVQGIAPGMEKEFWKEINQPANFMKHADKDPDGEYENFEEEANDGILFACALYFESLGNQLTPEMKNIIAFFTVRHPEFLRDTARPSLRDVAMGTDAASFRRMSRTDHLSIMKLVMEQLPGAK